MAQEEPRLSHRSRASGRGRVVCPARRAGEAPKRAYPESVGAFSRSRRGRPRKCYQRISTFAGYSSLSTQKPLRRPTGALGERGVLDRPARARPIANMRPTPSKARLGRRAAGRHVSVCNDPKPRWRLTRRTRRLTTNAMPSWRRCATRSICSSARCSPICRRTPGFSALWAGTGQELVYLAEKFPRWRFAAVEPSAPMLAVCRRKAEERGVAPRCVFHEGYLDSLPPSAPFDAATSLLVSQFILDPEASNRVLPRHRRPVASRGDLGRARIWRRTPPRRRTRACSKSGSG